MVVLDHAPRPFFHLVHADAGVDADVAQRVVQPLYVFGQLEGDAVEGTGGVKNRVAVDEPPVADGNARLRFRDHLAVEETMGSFCAITPPD